MKRSRHRAAVYKACRKNSLAADGSITVFASLTLLLVASFLLTLLEAARVQGCIAYARMNRVNAMESLFSEYNRDLLDAYEIFLLDGGFAQGNLNLGMIDSRLQAISQKNLRPIDENHILVKYQNFYQMDVPECKTRRYLLATDYNGAPFRAMVVKSMKSVYPLAMAEEALAKYQNAEHTMNQATQSQNQMDHAQSSLEAARRKQQESSSGTSDSSAQTQSAPAEYEEDSSENPIEVIKKLKKKDMLTILVPPGRLISDKSIKAEERLEKRTLQTGNMECLYADGIYGAVLFQQFLRNNFECFTTVSPKQHALDYELEYILAGKASDRENLKTVVTELLLLREGANFLYLQTDEAKKEEALAVATALAAAVLLPEIAPILQQGILAAWAYGESVLDVRTLLAGGRVPWTKTAEEWKTSLSGLSALAESQAGEDSGGGNGDDYTEYLQKLLYLKSKKVLNYRTMDLLEQWQRLKLGYEKLKMDSMILALETEFTYETAPLFSTMVTISRLGTENWCFNEIETYAYLKEP